MINLTIEPQLVFPASTGQMLRDAIMVAISIEIDDESEDLVSQKQPHADVDKFRQPTFSYFVREILINNCEFDLKWLQDAFKICQQNALKPKADANIDCLLRVPMGTLTINIYNEKTNKTLTSKGEQAIARLKRSLKNILLIMWSKGLIVLPFIFDQGRQTYRGEELTPLARLVAGSNNSDISQRGLKLLMTTDWANSSDVLLNEISVLHRQYLTKPTELGVIGATGKFPFIPLLKMIFKTGNASFSADELEEYELWINGRYHLNYTYYDFIANREVIASKMREVATVKKSKYSRSFDARRRGAMEKISPTTDFSEATVNDYLRNIARLSNHEAAVKYFAECSGKRRGSTLLPVYPGREHIDTENLSRNWLPLFSSFLSYRINIKNAESNERTRSDLGYIADYLFCYLPWWFELHAETSMVKYPETAGNFHRHIFVVSSELPIKNAPLPLLDFNNRRKSSEGQNSITYTLHSFFEYIRASQPKLKIYTGEILDNPVVLILDRKFHRRPTKTNKYVFRKKMLPYLLRYAYTLEKIGMELQRLALAGSIFEEDEQADEELGYNSTNTSTPMTDAEFRHSKAHSTEFVSLVKYAIDASFEFDDRTFQITEIPRVFHFSKRELIGTQGSPIQTVIAHLGALRINIGMLETGLRGQSIQWLDRRTWNHNNQDRSADDPIGSLWVNTDKVEDAGAIPVSSQVIAMFAREEAFQIKMLEEGMNTPIPYEQRDNSRFSEIVPLFRAKPYKYRGKTTGRPIADDMYLRSWNLLMLGFQNFYNEQVRKADIIDPLGQNYVVEHPIQLVRLNRCYPKGTSTLENHIVQYSKSGTPLYCPMKITSKATPHAARATFISARRSILPIQSIQRLVRHKNTRTTEFYTIPDFEELEQETAATHNMLWDFKELVSHVQSASPNSTMQRSFRADRANTIKIQAFINASFLNEADTKIREDALALLHVLPIDELLWLDYAICVFAGRCDLAGVLEEIEESFRCGLCPAACSGIDHLTGVTAKKLGLHLRLVDSAELLKDWTARVESGELPPSALAQLESQRALDAREALGYAERERTLLAAAAAQTETQGKDERLFASNAEFVRRKLKLVTKQTTETEFILHRITDASVYPSLQTPEIRMKANQFHQRLLAGLGDIRSLLEFPKPGTEVDSLLSLLKIRGTALSGGKVSSELLEKIATMLSVQLKKIEGGEK